ncbi:Cocaine esterase [Purpureocillium lavendulum]|uniref:Cocaine esterase n=1 Tax=Purpureocillium lavendulum TaxID=1247861 RepID=A0AB34FIQ6_9HYPO|nr:Cocaine esterase [Purpureocillium lavendulum]
MTAAYLSHHHIHAASVAAPGFRSRTFSSSSSNASSAALPSTSSSSSSSSTASFFQLPTTKRRNKQTRLMEQQQMDQAAAAHEEATLRAQAWLYINDFLDTSPDWSGMREQIAIVCEAVPTMPELNAYGELDDKDGTRACRRLFKAPVVWDELGHSLWKALRDAAEQRDLARKLFQAEWCVALEGFADVDYGSAAGEQQQDSSVRGGGRRRASESTVGTGISSRSSSVSPLDRVSEAASIKVKKQSSRLNLKLSKKFSISTVSSRRGSSDTDRECAASGPLPQHQQPADGDRPTIPRIIPSNYMSAMRRTLGLFGDGARHSR